MRLVRALRAAETLQRRQSVGSARDWFVRALALSAAESVAGAVLASFDRDLAERWTGTYAVPWPLIAPEETVTLTLGAELASVVEQAKRIAERLRDSHVGTEHALLALAITPDSQVAKLLAQHGFDGDGLFRAAQRYRPTSGWRPQPQLEPGESESLANNPCWDGVVVRTMCLPSSLDPARLTFEAGVRSSVDSTDWRPGCESWRTRWRRFRTLRRLRTLFGSRTVRRVAFDLHLVGCDEEETQRVLCLDERVLDATLETIRSSLGVPRERRRLSAVCVGSRVDRAVAESKAALGFSGDAQAFWWRKPGVAVLDLPQLAGAARLLEALVHELAHGMLILLPYPYRYPYVLQEGFATTCGVAYSVEYDVGSLHGRPSIPWSRFRGQITAAEHLSIRQLACHRGESMQGGRFHRASQALLAFLGFSNYVRCDPLRPLLIRIRRERPHPQHFLEYLAGRLNTTPDGLEDAFAQFSVHGQLPS